MGKHDKFGHLMHLTKQMRFKQSKPSNAITNQTSTAPQNPHIGTNAQNNYRQMRGE